MWEHNGVCSCGERTFLFSQCRKCLEMEAQNRQVEAAEAAHDLPAPLERVPEADEALALAEERDEAHVEPVHPRGVGYSGSRLELHDELPWLPLAIKSETNAVIFITDRTVRHTLWQS